MIHLLLNRRFQFAFPKHNLGTAHFITHSRQINMRTGMRAYFLPSCRPLLKLLFIHQRGLRNAQGLIPDVGFAQQATHRITSRRKPLLQQRRQRMDKIVFIAVIKSNAGHLACFFTQQVRQ